MKSNLNEIYIECLWNWKKKRSQIRGDETGGFLVMLGSEIDSSVLKKDFFN